MLDTNDSEALDKAAAILANDDFLQAATMSLGSSTRDYGAPSVLFTAPIRPNSPERGQRLGVSASMPGLGKGSSKPRVVQSSGEDGDQLWADRTNRGKREVGITRHGNAKSMSALPSRGMADKAEKTDADTKSKKKPLQFGAGEAPLAVSRSLDGTWHQVGIVAAPYERPVLGARYSLLSIGTTRFVILQG